MLEHLTILYSILLVLSLGVIGWLLWQKHHGKSKIRR